MITSAAATSVEQVNWGRNGSQVIASAVAQLSMPLLEGSKVRVTVVAVVLSAVLPWFTGAASAMSPLAGLPAPASISVTDAPGYAEADGAPSSPLSAPLAAQTLAGPMSAGAYQDTFVCTDAWEYIAAMKNSFVTGNCHNAWKLARTTRDYDPVHAEYWDGGYVNGSYDGCGWMRQSDTTFYSYDDGTGCLSPDRTYCDYIYCDASNNPATYGTADEGQSTPVTNPSACIEFANFRPWIAAPSGSIPTSVIRYAPPTLWIRYLTKYKYGGVYWLMAHDRVAADGTGTWVFVPQSCFFAPG